MKTLFSFSACTLVLCILLSSCQSDNEITSPSETLSSTFYVAGEELIVMDGLVHVPNQEALAAIDGSIHSVRELDVPSTNFTSLKESFDDFVIEFRELADPDSPMPAVPAKYRPVVNIVEVDEDLYVKPTTDWPVYSALANQNAQLIVGSQLLTIVPKGIVIIPASGMQDYGSHPEDHPQATTHLFKENEVGSTEEGDAKGEVGYCDTHFGPRRKGHRKVVGKIISRVNWFNGSISWKAQTKLWRMNWFRTYFPEEANEMEVNATLDFGGSGEQVFETEDDTASIVLSFNSQGEITAFFGGGFHRAVEIGQNRSCFSQPQSSS